MPFWNNYLYNYPSIHHIIIYRTLQDINLLNSCISTIISKKDGKTHIYKKILDFNNIKNKNIYIHMIYSHNNNLIRGIIYFNNKNFKINNYYYSSHNINNKYYDYVGFCKFNL